MKKGFTLIELLAVIIILAVIALITTPVILNVVDEAKESSRINSVNNLIDATRLYMTEAILDDSIDLSGNLLSTINSRVKGTKPDEGEIRIDGNDIGIAVKIDGYCYIKDYSDNEIIKTNDSDCVIYKVVEATCYDGEAKIIDDFEINYDGCVANLNDAWGEDYTEEELDKYCKNEEKINDDYGIYYLKDYVMFDYANDNIDYLIEYDIINVTYETVCQTCFEYTNNISQITYDINYERCIEEVADSFVKNKENFCSGGREEIINKDNYYYGQKLTFKEMIDEMIDNYFESFGYSVLSGLIENLSFEKSSEATITNYLCYEGNELGLPTITDVVIPSKINDLKVSDIGTGAFAEKELTNITISHVVKAIGHSAFYNNQISGELDLSNTKLTTIDYDAFRDNQITSVKLPSSITTIGSDAFYGNQISGELDLSNTKLTTIDYDAFRDNQINSLKLPNSLERININAFYDNQIEGELDLSNTKLTTIGFDAFSHNQITSVKLPNTLEIIGQQAFWGNKISGELDLSNTKLTTIGSYAFYNNQITSIKLPNTLEIIRQQAFWGNKISGELDLSNTNLTTIEKYAFEFNEITSVKLPNSITSIDDGAFNYNFNLTLIEIDNIKNAISGSPWGASKAEIKWLRDSE